MRRLIAATLWRSQGPNKDRTKVWVRHYGRMDSALPRAVQLAIREGVAGDVVEFTSTEFGFHLGIARILTRGRFEQELSELALDSPNLMSLM